MDVLDSNLETIEDNIHAAVSMVNINMPVKLIVDPESSRGIGAGVPHYAAWSPVGNRLAVITGTEFGLTTMTLGARAGESPWSLGVGGPVYLSWAPDASRMLMHQSDDVHLLELGADGEIRARWQVGSGSISYNAAKWDPSGERFVYAEALDTGIDIKIAEATRPPIGVKITDGGAHNAFEWSPDGNSMAIARSATGGQVFDSLSLWSADSAEETSLLSSSFLSFWWSPDGTRIAVASIDEEEADAFKWSVIDIETGEGTVVGRHVASNEFFFMLSFFDQYSESTSVWSPDSRRLVLPGALVGDESRDSSELLSEIWVIDTLGEEAPVSLGGGTSASWSPK